MAEYLAPRSAHESSFAGRDPCEGRLASCSVRRDPAGSSAISSCAMTAKIDVIDVAGLQSGDPRALERIAGQLEDPSRTRGMVHVVGHGIPGASLEGFDASMRALFALPRDVKESVRRTRANA